MNVIMGGGVLPPLIFRGEMLKNLIEELGPSDFNQDVSSWLNTGYLPLNKIISGKYHGGIPVGRVTEIFGGESCGKTLLATMAMMSTQQLGGAAILLDYERAFSVSRAHQLGMSIDDDCWFYKQPLTAEEGFYIIDTIAETVRKNQTTKHITVVVDSIASMVPKSVVETGYDDLNMKTNLSLAMLLSSALPKVVNTINKNNITLIFLNQVRDNPGVMFGEKEKTPGGKAMKFYASLRVKLTKRGKVKDGDVIIGENVQAEVVKNKVYEPFQNTTYLSNFSVGIDLVVSHINHAVEQGWLGTSKGWVDWDGKKMRPNILVETLKNEPEAYSQFLTLFKDVE